ncbi:MAG: alpha/beta hydrolase [Flavobacterium sp. MedPE-SWcel]|uniref:alpha/beta hydrolase n=1 Tax=uncultured Flavobacterium sp. TaxID=165435 RepID=UPI00091B0C30|nr:alpha/beta fold hydrolase [uncultured Flavobacterium sp.]OIQ16252.1 MAG: alpha/beta hydrolase [Flavobacterium sp. MedPE-SWcel]
MPKVLKYIFTKTLGLYINTLSYTSPNKAKKLAYKFFSEPREGRLEKDNLPQILQEADTETITHNEFIFQTYTWKGNNKKILLVHGWESNTSRWEQFIPYLKKEGYTITALDAPAHGLSSGQEFNIPRYAEFIDIIVKKVQPSYMIGHSLGGATALYYQARYQSDYLKKMIVLGAPSDLETLLYNYSKMLNLNDRVMSLLESIFINRFNIKPEEFSGSVFASTIKTQGFIAHDANDEIVNITEAKKIASTWENADFIVTQGLKHSMHDDDLYNKMCTFLKTE